MTDIKGKNRKSEPTGENRKPVPILTPGIGTRIKRVSEMLGGNAAAGRIAFKSDIQIGRYIREESAPSIDVIVALAKAAGVSIGWLATGEGPMRPGEVQQDLDEEFAFVPYYDVEASAGHGRMVEQEEQIGRLAFRRDWLKRKGLSIKRLAVIRIAGDSMAPTIPDGALALVDTSQKEVRHDGLYVLQLDGALIAKRLQRDLATGGLYIKSDNPAYTDQHITPDQARHLNIVGRIIWAGAEV